MQTTYRLNVQDIDASFLDSIKTLFKNKEVNITIDDVELKDPVINQMEIFMKMEQTRKSLKHIKIPKDLNINDLIDEMYDVEL